VLDVNGGKPIARILRPQLDELFAEQGHPGD